MLTVMGMAPFFIRFLKQRMLGQFIREDGPAHHHVKAGTPTMGGVLILLALISGIAAMVFLGQTDFLTDEFWLAVLSTVLLGGLGLYDDVMKITKQQNKGLSGYTKLAVQGLVGAGLGWYIMTTYHTTDVPFLTLFRVDFGWFYPVFTAIVVMATSNAVNLTDGLDGLAAGTSIVSLSTLSVVFAGLLWADHAAVYPDLAALAIILTGGTLGFLFYNMYPARLFMGDTGSLSLGGAMAAMAILSKSSVWLGLIGAVFVIEALSVILQVASFKTTGRRIFKMSPFHHHLELCGWSESQVVMALITVQLACCGLAVFLYNRG